MPICLNYAYFPVITTIFKERNNQATDIKRPSIDKKQLWITYDKAVYM